MRWLGLVAAAWLTSSAPAPAQAPQRACITIEVSAPYGAIGYNHVARTQNQCRARVRCTLWTDVDPEPRHVLELEPGADQTIVFRRNAPGYGFRTYYRCQYR